MGYKYLRFDVPYKQEKCPPRVQTAAGKRQTREMSGHMIVSAVYRKKNMQCLISPMTTFFKPVCGNIVSVSGRTMGGGISPGNVKLSLKPNPLSYWTPSLSSSCRTFKLLVSLRSLLFFYIAWFLPEL